jgi:CBS domain containing-hemolysin-like protein
MEGLLLTLLLVCAAVSFLMSGMEAGLFVLSRLRIRHLMRRGDARAQLLHRYLERPERFLWTSLIGNILANVALTSLAFLGLWRWLGPWPALFWAAVLGVVLLGYALCELLPKMLFRLYPDRLCLALVRCFRLVDLGLRPVVFLMTLLSDVLLIWSGGRRFTGRLFANREELRQLMQESAHGLTREERSMINQVLDLQKLTVRQIAVPLAKAVMTSADAPLREFFGRARETGFSRMPVWQTDGTRRRIIGLASVRPLVYQEGLDESRPVGESVRAALYLSEDTRLEQALRQMQRAGQRLAVVLGSDRTELGVVSLHDILQVIFGGVNR